MTKRAFTIIIAAACLALLSQASALAQTTVFVDNGVVATNYTANGVGAPVVTTGTEVIQITSDGVLNHAIINTAPSVAGHAWTTANGGLAVNSANLNNKLIVDNVSSFIGNANAGLNVPDAGTSATLLVQSGTAARGLDINQSRTILSGGADGTTLTLDDTGATFQNTVTGGPALVHGVANGIDPFDAVNVDQLHHQRSQLSGGIASVAALAAIPGPNPCKNYSFGLGFGNYMNESAGAIGIKGYTAKRNLEWGAGAAFSNSSSPAYNFGIGLGF